VKRIMIVDDEFLVRMGIKSMLNWEETGYSIVCEAVNGQDAIKKIQQYAPQIILTDLVMEPVSGLDLIQYCRRNYPDIKIVVLSNYNDFENVRAAMKLGARDFLFKLTTNAQELLKILDGISEEIDQRQVIDENAEAMLIRNADAIRQHLIGTMIDSTYKNEADLISELRLADVKCDFTKLYRIMFLSVANYALFENSINVAGHRMLIVSLEHIVSDQIGKLYPAQTFHNDYGQYVVSINNGTAVDKSVFENEMQDCFVHINEYSERYFGVKLCGALSGECLGCDALSAKVTECRRVIKNSFFLKQARLLHVSEYEATHKGISVLPVLDISHLQMALANFQFHEVMSCIDDFIDQCYDLVGIDSYLVREKLYEFYRTIKSDSITKGIILDNIVDRNGLALYQAIFQYDLLMNISDSFSSLIQNYEEECMKIGGKKLKKEIAKILMYVNANLSTDLSITHVAGIANMSESYFSHLFKNEMGISFVDYVNRVRIEKAKEMLVRTELRVNEIGSAVGIENSNYFSILFKKLAGSTPIQYRNEHLAG